MNRITIFLSLMLVFAISCEGVGYSTRYPGGNQNNANNQNNQNNTNNQNNLDPDIDNDGDGWTINEGDCDDTNPNVHPGAVEICDDGIDNDCNGYIDHQEPDKDGDGYGPCNGDCNDNDPLIHPGMPEIPDDGIDNNCDGIIDGDYDGDGWTVEDGDCDDFNPLVHPGAREDCFDGIDNDCNGYIDGEEPDMDGDGFGPCGGDCDDTNPNVYPGAPEIPGDGIDNNCDNLIDQDLDGDGWTVANGDCDDNDPSINPAVWEVCGDGIDNNCNGIIDDDCFTPCQLAEFTRSSVGCVYYAVDTDNYSGYDNLQFAVGISNTHASQAANVQVFIKNAGTWQVLESRSVLPGTLAQFNLPNRHVDNTNLHVGGAFKIVSDLPVIAYQFQPVDGVSSYTSDASLLLPTSALDRFYHVVGWGIGAGRPQVVIVATQNGTQVTMTPRYNTLAGGPVPALTANVAHTFTQTLNEGDYLQIESSNNNPMNGTIIQSNHPIAVFSCHTCANIPNTGCCCDHVEEQLIGLQSWGNVYVAARMPVRSTGTPEATVWHIYASENNTSIHFTAHPQVTGLPASPQTLNAGQYLELSVSGTMANPGDFVVTANRPILVMEYLTGSYTTNVSADRAGDPAMTQMVPVAQFLDSYIILVPVNWIYDYAILIKPVGASIWRGGTLVPQASFIPVFDGVNPAQWEVARIAIPDGIHAFTGTHPFGIIIVGYDSYDSYAYPGGMNMQILNPIN